MTTATAGDYDYLNARVRGMSASLLSAEVLEQILESDGDEVLIDVLLDTEYGTYLSTVLKTRSNTVAIEDALKRNLYATVAKVRSIAPPRPLRLIDMQLGRWDVSNIISILRGVRVGWRTQRAVDALVPAGRYGPAQLEELAKETDLRSVADSLTQWDSPLGPVLRRSILASEGETDPARLESDLYVEYFVRVFEQLDTDDANARLVRDQLRLQADMINVLSVLKQVDSRSRGVQEPDISRIPGGFIGPSEIRSLYESENLELALETLDGTEFSPAVERGILAFGESDRLSVLERFLEALVTERGVALFRKDPLNISVSIGFLWRKLNEFTNLRILARGKRYKLPPATIREEMVFV